MGAKSHAKVFLATEILISVVAVVTILLMAIGIIGSTYWPMVIALLTIFIVCLVILAIFTT